MPTQAVVCKTASAPGKAPDQTYPMMFHGRPVKKCPRAQSAALHSTANRQSRPTAVSPKRLPASRVSPSAAAIYTAIAAGRPSTAKGSTHQKRAMSTNSAAAIQYSPATRKPSPNT